MNGASRSKITGLFPSSGRRGNLGLASRDHPRLESLQQLAVGPEIALAQGVQRRDAIQQALLVGDVDEVQRAYGNSPRVSAAARPFRSSISTTFTCISKARLMASVSPLPSWMV